MSTRDRAFPHGQLTITTAATDLSVGDPLACAQAAIKQIDQARGSHIVLLPELTLGGYSCGDLFGTDAFTAAVENAVQQVCLATVGSHCLVVLGSPFRAKDRWLNSALVIADGQILGIVPKQFLPNYREFYEQRHFRPGSIDLPKQIHWCGQSQIALGIDLLFRWGDAVVGIEICEDLWVPIPPSSGLALAGANVLLNLSASNETVGKADWRRSLVINQSGRCLAAYAYASAGPSESTTDLVFSGHCLIAENGRLLAEAQPLATLPPQLNSPATATATIDLQRLNHDRGKINTFSEGQRWLPFPYRTIDISLPITPAVSPPSATAGSNQSPGDGNPFVPHDAAMLSSRCHEILAIQVAALAKRLSRLPTNAPLVIGVSGGLDSTLALMVATATCDAVGCPRSRIIGITMPGFGTTQRTLANAVALMDCLSTTTESIDIRRLSLDTFLALQHSPLGLTLTDNETIEGLQQRLIDLPDGGRDLVFENVQARLRTYLLMNRGFVLGTGDLSEQALGWSTYNGDHMSMYNVNASVPKTLVRFLVQHLALQATEPQLRDVLLAIAATPISPELMPPDASGEIRQRSEDTLGAYELHDFFLYHFVRFGASRDKIRYLAQQARFQTHYAHDEIDRALDVFFQRFFANQFKRSCVPDGPKIGSVSLSPRGDWRMPSDAQSDAF